MTSSVYETCELSIVTSSHLAYVSQEWLDCSCVCVHVCVCVRAALLLGLYELVDRCDAHCKDA